MDSNIKSLSTIDWNFSDYKSLYFPSDLASFHWYPAAFVPQIPYILIELLSNRGDIVLDPFAGSGITLIESSRLLRKFIGIDSNPFAVDIVLAKLKVLSSTTKNCFEQEINKISNIKPIENIHKHSKSNAINEEVFKWFEENTLSELLAIQKYIMKNDNVTRRIIFSSILNKCCSQREHYTYITDRCFPSELIYKPAIQLYVEQLKLIENSAATAKEHFKLINKLEWEPITNGFIHMGDARNINFLKKDSIDLIVTSPPYLGVNDYVRSMRLTYLFFPTSLFDFAIENEIGARRKRNRKLAYKEYVSDLRKCFIEMTRVLKKGSFLCLVMGQGRGKVNKSNIVQDQIDLLEKELGFRLVYKEKRNIKFRRIQVPGVGKELILVLQKAKDI